MRDQLIYAQCACSPLEVITLCYSYREPAALAGGSSSRFRRQAVYYIRGGEKTRHKATSSSTGTSTRGRSKPQSGSARQLHSGQRVQPEQLPAGLSGGLGSTYPRNGIGGYPTYPSGSVTFGNYAGTGRSTADSTYLGFG